MDECKPLLEGSADSTDSSGSADMDLFRGRALLQAGTHTRQLPTSSRAAPATQSNPSTPPERPLYTRLTYSQKHPVSSHKKPKNE